MVEERNKKGRRMEVLYLRLAVGNTSTRKQHRPPARLASHSLGASENGKKESLLLRPGSAQGPPTQSSQGGLRLESQPEGGYAHPLSKHSVDFPHSINQQWHQEGARSPLLCWCPNRPPPSLDRSFICEAYSVDGSRRKLQFAKTCELNCALDCEITKYLLFCATNYKKRFRNKLRLFSIFSIKKGSFNNYKYPAMAQRTWHAEVPKIPHANPGLVNQISVVLARVCAGGLNFFFVPGDPAHVP